MNRNDVKLKGFSDMQDLSWYGQSVDEYKCGLSELENTLPRFSRHQFGCNEYLDVILRDQAEGDQREIPVASVSRKYYLIQHQEIARWLLAGIVSAGFQPESISVIVTASEYYERILLSIAMPEYMFDPGDGFELLPTLEVINSVDKTTSFQVRMTWYRLICKNGMIGLEEDGLRIIHNIDWKKNADVSAFIHNEIASIPSIVQTFRSWLDTPVNLSKCSEWADKVLPKEWGVTAAARFISILKTGYDGKIDPSTSHLQPSKRPVSRDIKVPGATAPVNNAYHVLQALSWIASRKQSVETSLKMRRDTPRLFKSLLEID